MRLEIEGQPFPVGRRRAWLRSIPATAFLFVQAACGADNTPAGTNNPPPCAVSGVTVTANPPATTAGSIVALLAAVQANATCSGGVTWSAAPDGGTLTSSALAATFTTPSAGTYTLRATSTDDPTKSGSVAVTVTAATPPCGQATGTVTTHSANVAANETWAGDGITHLIPNSISITGSAVLTIQPCAVVALGQGVSITIRDNARLVSAGTSNTRFVTFRRNNAAQAWGTLRGFTATSLIDLTWTTLEGGGAFGSLSDPTIAVIGNGYGSPVVGVLRANNVTIRGSQGIGVHLDANAGFTNDSQQLVITESGANPILATMMSLSTVPSGTYTGNKTNEFLIFGNPNVFGDITIEDRGVPVRIPFGSVYVGPAVGATAPVTLTLRPGVVFKFPRLGLPLAPGARVTFGTNGNAPNNLVGVLNAIGTAAKPIVFTSGEASPVAGDWVGIWLNTANGSRLDYVEISYAGAANGIQSNNCRLVNTPDNAALLVGSFSSQYVPPANMMTNSRITNSAGYGINAMWQAPTFNSPDLTATNTFEGNARCRQSYNGLNPPGVCPMGGGCTVL